MPSRPVAKSKGSGGPVEGQEADKTGMCAAIFTLCISIPALVGS